ncbi:MAG TPA: ABC transporter permease [Gemmatimonadaceae bacterium]|nr:ABC transporter permease [Gemmatimonadaceae bacterium]
MRNLKLALRTLTRTPFVTAVAALSLGLGIGANAAIYSMFHRMLRQDLSVPEPGRLVNLAAPGPKPGGQSCGSAGSCDVVFSYPMFRDLQKSNQRVFTAIAAHREVGANVSYERRAFSASGLLVSGTYFPLLAAQPAFGRLFAASDDEIPGGHPVVVLGHRFWEDKLGADSAVLGKTLTVNGKSMTIIGVASKGFDGTTVGVRPDFYAPLAMSRMIDVGMGQQMDDRRAYWLYLFARLAPGVTLEQASIAINAVYRPIINDVEAPLQKNMRDSVMPRFRAKQILVSEGRRGQSDNEEAKTPLFLLFGITGFVLLIACANIANLLLARATNRELEMGVRLSLGATRRQLLSQLLTESLTLAFIGGAISILFASWTLRGLAALLPADFTSRIDFTVNWAAVAFAGVLSLTTGIAFGLFPAMHSTRPDLVTALRNNSGKLAGGKAARRFRTALATAQIALAMALLMGAGLFLKSLWNVSRVNLGVKVEKMVTFQLGPERSGYDSVRMRTLFDRVEDELRGVPGATAVTSAMVPLIGGSSWGTGVSVQGYTGTRNTSRFNAVGPGYFRAVGIDLLAGREFTDADDSGTPRVAVVNETFARTFGLGANPVGRRMATRTGDTVTFDIEIVGLVRDSKYNGVKDTIPPVFTTPHHQERVGEMNFYVRTDGDPATLLRAIPAVVRRIDPMLPVDRLNTMPEQIRLNTSVDRMISTMSSAFALLATLLACIGLYGVLAYSVAQRTREIGVRMALGASATEVLAMVLRQVGLMVLIGGGIGLAGAVALGRVAGSIFFEMSSSDPVVMLGATMLLGLVALAAGYVPALRASRVDPMQALRYE